MGIIMRTENQNLLPMPFYDLDMATLNRTNKLQ